MQKSKVKILGVASILIFAFNIFGISTSAVITYDSDKVPNCNNYYLKIVGDDNVAAQYSKEDKEYTFNYKLQWNLICDDQNVFKDDANEGDLLILSECPVDQVFNAGICRPLTTTTKVENVIKLKGLGCRNIYYELNRGVHDTKLKNPIGYHKVCLESSNKIANYLKSKIGTIFIASIVASSSLIFGIIYGLKVYLSKTA